jgi:LacI family transcriptional regulator
MKRPNIKDIAQSLGISIGTVDRALHGRPEVSPKTRALVLKATKELGYQPNLAARSLKLNRRLRIGIYFPREIASFFEPLRDGVRAAAAASAGINLDLVFRTFPRLDVGVLELLASDSGEAFDGVLITPGNPQHLGPAIDALVGKGVAVVCVASDAPQSARLACITADARVSGAIAAELFSRTLREPAHLAAFAGDLTILDHAEKMRGFEQNLAVFAPQLKLLPVIESHEQPALAYQQALELFSRSPRPAGVYISTANSLPVLRALEEKKMLGQIQIIATDLFPKLMPFITSGEILATLYQRPFTQGKTALELLLRYLIQGKSPDAITRLAPHILMRSNLCLFASVTARIDGPAILEDENVSAGISTSAVKPQYPHGIRPRVVQKAQ